MNIKDIEAYIVNLEKNEMDFKAKSLGEKSLETQNKVDFLMKLKSFIIMFSSIYDYIYLLFLLRFKKSFFHNKRIVYTAKNFTTINDGVLEDRIVKPIFPDNVIFLSHAKDYRISKINQTKVFNIGGIVKLISKIKYQKYSHKMQAFIAYMKVNDSILKSLLGHEVYTLCYYDLNGLSLAFSKYRDKIKLGEVQHGSIINYPPYALEAPFALVDVFYVKNKETIEYLKQNLCKNFEADYRLIPYPKIERVNRAGTNIFYASTVEFNGFHPVFLDFIEHNEICDLNVIVRLHPREREKENIFKGILEKYKINYKFDNSKNWLENNEIKNLIVVSPWSSSIEDSYDNKFVTIVIDPVGKERFAHLIDNQQCFFSDNLNATIGDILIEGNR